MAEIMSAEAFVKGNANWVHGSYLETKAIELLRSRDKAIVERIRELIRKYQYANDGTWQQALAICNKATDDVLRELGGE